MSCLVLSDLSLYKSKCKAAHGIYKEELPNSQKRMGFGSGITPAITLLSHINFCHSYFLTLT